MTTAAPDLLKNRTILVTGASQGLGRAAAIAYARHGATVILLGRSVRKLEQVYDEISPSAVRNRPSFRWIWPPPAMPITPPWRRPSVIRLAISTASCIAPPRLKRWRRKRWKVLKAG
jgi:NAD(P)-dependent dehydrogenase (short-subunit alcohol dehydrogenase family)